MKGLTFKYWRLLWACGVLLSMIVEACPPCPPGSTYKGSGASTNVSGCRCTTTSMSWNGSACVSTTNPCPTQTRTWSSCSASVTSANHGVGRTVSNSASGYSGSATYVCSNGTWSLQSGSTCSVSYSNCSSASRAWGSGCSATLPARNHGASATVPNGASGYTGSATFSCNNGGWSLQSGSSCTVNCVAAGQPAPPPLSNPVTTPDLACMAARQAALDACVNGVCATPGCLAIVPCNNACASCHHGVSQMVCYSITTVTAPGCCSGKAYGNTSTATCMN